MKLFLGILVLWPMAVFGLSYWQDNTVFHGMTFIDFGIKFAEVVSPLALLGVFISLWMQQRQFKAQSARLHEQTKALVESARQQGLQNNQLTAQTKALIESADQQQSQTKALSSSVKQQITQTNIMAQQAAQEADVVKIHTIDRRAENFARQVVHTAARTILTLGERDELPLLGDKVVLAEALERGPDFLLQDVRENIKDSIERLDLWKSVGLNSRDLQSAESLINNLKSACDMQKNYLFAADHGEAKVKLASLRMGVTLNSLESLATKLEQIRQIYPVAAE